MTAAVVELGQLISDDFNADDREQLLLIHKVTYSAMRCAVRTLEILGDVADRIDTDTLLCALRDVQRSIDGVAKATDRDVGAVERRGGERQAARQQKAAAAEESTPAEPEPAEQSPEAAGPSGSDEFAPPKPSVPELVEDSLPSWYQQWAADVNALLEDAEVADEPRCPDPECGEPLRLIGSGTVGHSGRDCSNEASVADLEEQREAPVRQVRCGACDNEITWDGGRWIHVDPTLGIIHDAELLPADATGEGGGLVPPIPDEALVVLPPGWSTPESWHAEGPIPVPISFSSPVTMPTSKLHGLRELLARVFRWFADQVPAWWVAAAGIATAIVGILVLAGCGSAPRPGSPAVYEAIAAETSCARLQERFDRADADHTRNTDRGRADLAIASTGYMEAADERMLELGCYG